MNILVLTAYAPVLHVHGGGVRMFHNIRIRGAMEPDVKFKLFYRWMQMLRYEVLMPRKFDRVVTMTENDADYLRSYSPAANIRAIPIGIDASEFAPLPEEPSRPIEVLFVGNFRHSPNVEAAEFLV